MASINLIALQDSFDAVGAFDVDILYVYSDLRALGALAATFPSRQAFCDELMAPLSSRGKTIIMTTFTYTSQGRFDVLTTPTKLGVLNKWILSQPGVHRSEHPLFSYAAIGPDSSIVIDIGKSAFGTDSVFARLENRRAAFLHIGRPVWMGNTALHYVEQAGGATYRVNKAFKTEVFRGDAYVGTNYSAFVRRMDVSGETFAFNFRKAAAKLFSRGIVRQKGSEEDLTNVSLLPYDDTLAELQKMFFDDPTIFISSNFIQY